LKKVRIKIILVSSLLIFFKLKNFPEEGSFKVPPQGDRGVLCLF